MDCPPVIKSNAQKIYETAKNCIGKDLCGFVDNAYGCAQTVNSIVEAALGQQIGGGASTYLMFLCLKNQTNPVIKFVQVPTPIPGDIIISPSGYSTKGVNHGHVGIVAMHGVLSNNSSTGNVDEIYNLETWDDFFHIKEGFPTYYFHAL